MNFNGPAKRLDDIDIPRIAALIDVGEDELHAIIDTETCGSGFDAADRPRMLFEPHVFYRNLSGAKRVKAVKLGLAYPEWGTKPYPKNSYPRLAGAMAIDETAALRSASWGLGQILGENHKAAGYATVQAMVTDFTVDEDRQLEAVVRFIQANGLADEVQRHDWAGLARGYNGKGYARNGYHTKLSAAFRRWQRIQDTPWTVAPIVAAAAPAPAPTKPAAPTPLAKPATGLWARVKAAIGRKTA